MSFTGEQLVPATIQQEGIWFHALTNSSSYWNLVNARSYTGTLDIPVLKQALEKVIAKHASLRTNFTVNDDQLYQVVNAATGVEIIFEQFTWQEGSQEHRIEQARAKVEESQKYEFDFGAECLLKFQVHQVDDLYMLALVISHIITDGISMQVFWNELATYYNALVKGNMPVNIPVRQYTDFAVEQKQFAQTEPYRLQKEYWLGKFTGEPPVLNLPFTADRSTARVYAAEFGITAGMVAEIKTLALKHKVLYSAVYLLAYYILLYKYSKQNRIVVGNVINGRGFSGKSRNNNSIGLFANRLAQVQEIHEQDTIASLLHNVHAEMLESFNNGDVPLEEIARESNKKLKTGTFSLYQAAFNKIRAGQANLVFEGLEEVTGLVLREKTAVITNVEYLYDITLFVIDHIQDVRIRIEFKCDESMRSITSLVGESYRQMLTTCISCPHKRLAEIDILVEQEKQMLARFNDTQYKYGEQTLL